MDLRNEPHTPVSDWWGGAGVSAGYNATIPPGGNVSFGFQGTWTTNDAAPASLTLNGAVCR